MLIINYFVRLAQNFNALKYNKLLLFCGYYIFRQPNKIIQEISIVKPNERICNDGMDDRH